MDLKYLVLWRTYKKDGLCLSIFKRANKKLLNAEIVISNDLHLHNEHCPKKANLLDWDDYEIKK